MDDAIAWTVAGLTLIVAVLSTVFVIGQHQIFTFAVVLAFIAFAYYQKTIGTKEMQKANSISYLTDKAREGINANEHAEILSKASIRKHMFSTALSCSAICVNYIVGL